MWLSNFFPFYYNPAAIKKANYYNANLVFTNPEIRLNKGILFDDFIKNLKNNWKKLKPIGLDHKNLPILTEAINILIKGIYT